MINKFIVSAIIGYWRSEGSINEICGLTGLKEYGVKYIIYGYTKQLSYGEI